jgi:hypothetical protein
MFILFVSLQRVNMLIVLFWFMLVSKTEVLKLFSSPTTVTIQNMYTYHCHNTKHVYVPLSQYKTCIRTTHNTQHVHVPLSQSQSPSKTLDP